jgi:hypothetical protein
MMTIVLLFIILLLLAGIVTMMLTGWPGRERAEIERSGNALRREMAEHRGESIQLLHSIRIDLEETLREIIEREMAIHTIKSGRYRGSGASRSSGRQSRPAQPRESTVAGSGEWAETTGVDCLMVQESGTGYGGEEAFIEPLQLLLFPEPAEIGAQPPPSEQVTSGNTTQLSPDSVEPVFTRSFGYAIDDLPDVD